MSDFADLADLSVTHEWAQRQMRPTEAVPTPFPTLNSVCSDDGGGVGIAPGWFVTIGGSSGQGKSLLAQNMALHAMKQGRKVAFISLEMSMTQLATRFYAMATDTPIRSIDRGRLDHDSFEPLWNGLCDVRDRTSGRFFVNRSPISTIDDVLVSARLLRESEGCDYFVLDYMQLCSTGDEESIYKQVTEVANAMRVFALTESVVVLGLSQYATQVVRDKRQPMMYDMMGGGTIANNGDLVLLLDLSRYERDQMQRHLARTYLLVAKNRHGAEGEVPILWDYRTLTVREGLDDEVGSWPK